LQRIHKEVPSDCGAGIFSNYLVFPRPPADVCTKALAFNGMKSNNLNGFGPAKGAEAFRFSEVLPGIDLVVKADDNYRPENAAKNGVLLRKYGRLNMASGTESMMNFRFVESNGQNPVKVERFLFTVFDIDHGNRCTSRMTVNATRYAAYYVDENTELAVHTDVGGPTWPASSTFTSSQRGTGKDNPKFPRKLNPAQRARLAATALATALSTTQSDAPQRNPAVATASIAAASKPVPSAASDVLPICWMHEHQSRQLRSVCD